MRLIFRPMRGFTLLEVLVALAITGMVLGTVFSLSAGSKRLALSASADLRSIVALRSAINAAQTRQQPDFPAPSASAENSAWKLRYNASDPLEKPERQTQKILYVLEPVEIQLENRERKVAPIACVRWKRLEAVQ